MQVIYTCSESRGEGILVGSSFNVLSSLKEDISNY